MGLLWESCIWPADLPGSGCEWLGLDDKSYGLERREGTDFIVTSGISDWAIRFKTGCKSEYVVIDIQGR